MRTIHLELLNKKELKILTPRELDSYYEQLKKIESKIRECLMSTLIIEMSNHVSKN